MKIISKIDINQKQRLNLTPFLKQSIDILRFSNKELEEFISEEIINNPILLKKNIIRKEQHHSRNKENHLEDKFDLYQNLSKSNNSLTDYLQEQVNLLRLTKQQQKVIEFIIGNINKNGYLDITSHYLSKKYNITIEQARKSISLIQTLEPSGVGALDLKECLLIQLRRKNLRNSLAYKIIENSLEDLAKNKISDISKTYNVSIEDISLAKKMILSLNPSPGSQFNESSIVNYVVPDLLIKKSNEEYVIQSNPKLSYNSLKINSYYLNINKDDCTVDEVNYINERIQSAVNILNNIEKRNKTLTDIVSLILKYQNDYFDNEKNHLKVLTRKFIANELGVHESTVSRAVSGKFIEYNKKIVNLKDFFQNGIKLSEEKSISTNQIKRKIKEIIDSENKNNPFSDKIISNKINKIGISISRRCVAKYRMSMDIPSSPDRRY